MGIKHFFTWFKSNFPNRITSFATLNRPEIPIDYFMVDLNGVFHNSAQKIFQYGNFARPQSILRPTRKPNASQLLYRACYEDVCQTIDTLVDIANPRERLILAIDGVAPLSKQNQQRQRRYRGVVENPTTPEGAFDANCITPGTEFMYDLSQYIDFHIRKNISSGKWKFEVIFSDEKCPGEGEHKLINFIRKFGTESKTYCINALDADLFMLSLGTKMPNFYLLREDLYDPRYDYMYVDIGEVDKDLKRLLAWEGCIPDSLIPDFILICFLCGNDFLPNIPSISIMENGLNDMVNFYKKNARHLVDEETKINIPAFRLFLESIAGSERNMMVNKIKHRNDYIEDTLLSKWSNPDDFVLPEYQTMYRERHGLEDVKTVCHSYLQGCHWVLSYYLSGIRNWDWMYRYSYAPFASDLALHIDTLEVSPFEKTEPLLPIQQLLCVLPPRSFKFLALPFRTFYQRFPDFYPEKFNINYEGKKKKWEGVVELPAIDVEAIKKESTPLLWKLSQQDVARNKTAIPVQYGVSEFLADFKCQFGTIRKCQVDVSEIIF